MSKSSQIYSIHPAPITAILVDGGFYRKRAACLFGHKQPEERAAELVEYCRRHLRRENSRLYRIFYYDCPPSEKVIYHPLLKKNIALGKSDDFKWMTQFHKSLKKQRKLALRMGENLETTNGYQLKSQSLKHLLSGKIDLSELSSEDFYLDITQKGVDMRVGLDIASLSDNGYVNQIVMISGDSDFVPAAKHSRRTGVDFILDPMWSHISESLHEHIDGLYTPVNKPPHNFNDPFHVDNIDSPLSHDDIDMT